MTAFIKTMMVLLGIGMFLNGIYMLYDPLSWYYVVPTVVGTGPFNQHFIRDIGIIHLLVGAGYVVGLFLPAQRVWMWSASTIFLGLHGIFHLWEVAVGICGPETIAQNGALVHLPAILGLIGVVWALSPLAAREART